VDKTFATNVKGVIFTVQEALPVLGDKASIILTGSTTSTRVGPAQTVYAASKAAVRSLARSWAVDLAGRAIRVNVLSPGPTRTPGLLGTAPGQEDELLTAISTLVPLGRIGEPAEIAAAAVFLASDDASFVNGIEFFVDGGHAQI
jgi:NAD(P)-dependent dehydrogenase (short-subunit alcohol dehydrogenase family)